jgi:hypothetical protein
MHIRFGHKLTDLHFSNSLKKQLNKVKLNT